ncbi:DNA-binding protein [Alkalispirochaeta sphaeroplastigenens]|uniref:DNA-binding protein n=2 Tax=Alkalispirochaeta sphaeroplastigenens TaxID=1187066 RepID=A0A2S4JQ65_9SPIO|nr:DNA-binding protein [Alkalispirochaeta sphaeroplastigenens]
MGFCRKVFCRNRRKFRCFIDQSRDMSNDPVMSTNNSFYQWFLDHITLHDHDDEKEELLNGLTHLLGGGLSLVALPAILIKALGGGNSSLLAAGLVFGLSMILLYFSSGMYHLVSGPVAKRVMRIMDHTTIYILIAGTYTPIMVYLGTSEAMIVLWTVWGLAAAGFFFTIFFWGRYGFLHVLFYLGMGWIVLLVWQTLREVVPPGLVHWTIAGGVTYTAGTIVYGLKMIPFYHAIWHLFVMGGSACFFIGIYQNLL